MITKDGVVMTKIAVFISGGVMTDVMSDNPNVEVELFDFDNEPELKIPEEYTESVW